MWSPIRTCSHFSTLNFGVLFSSVDPRLSSSNKLSATNNLDRSVQDRIFWTVPRGELRGSHVAEDEEEMEAQGRGAGRLETERRATGLVNYFLRLLALVTSFTAAVVAGSAKETEPVAANGGASAKLKIKAMGTPQFDYFVVVNAVACVYSAASLGLWAAAKGNSRSLIFVLAVTDVAAVALLFSALGSAAAMAILFRKGASPPAVYPRICNVYDMFCGLVFAAITMSTFAAVALFVLAVFSHFRLYYSSL
ncbi:CASP-like protein 1E1 [Wolffia australiana]